MAVVDSYPDSFISNGSKIFRKPFSAKGKISRKEFEFSYVIYIVSYLLAGIIFGFAPASISGIAALIIIVSGIWFIYAQGAKRCHDLGKSGWRQLIPFYRLIMLDKDGETSEEHVTPE